MDFDTITSADDMIFPGDANHDQIASNIDFLQLGVFYGVAGPARQNAIIDWVGQLGPDWDTTQANGYDIKHVDCDATALSTTMTARPFCSTMASPTAANECEEAPLSTCK